MNRQIVLDTETTGLTVVDGHRVIEVGCVELLNRRYTGNTFHQYFNPERQIEVGALQVHGITNEFIINQPLFRNHAQPFLDFINGAELIIHNAEFDVGFLNNELKLALGNFAGIASYCSVIDTLALARQKHPGQQNSLDALCRRYNVDNTHREYHGALLDAKLLAEVYLAMTSGQDSMFSEQENVAAANLLRKKTSSFVKAGDLPIIMATSEELAAHENRMKTIAKKSGKEFSF